MPRLPRGRGARASARSARPAGPPRTPRTGPAAGDPRRRDQGRPPARPSSPVRRSPRCSCRPGSSATGWARARTAREPSLNRRCQSEHQSQRVRHLVRDQQPGLAVLDHHARLDRRHSPPPAEDVGEVTALGELVQRRRRGRQQRDRAVPRGGDGVRGAQPRRLIGLRQVTGRLLAGRQRRREEPRVEPPRLGLWRDPARPRDQQVGANRQATTVQQARKESACPAVRPSGPLPRTGRPARAAKPVRRARQQHPRLFERLAHRRADQSARPARRNSQAVHRSPRATARATRSPRKSQPRPPTRRGRRTRQARTSSPPSGGASAPRHRPAGKDAAASRSPRSLAPPGRSAPRPCRRPAAPAGRRIPTPSSAVSSRRHFGDQLDLDRGVERQHRHPDRAPRVPAGLAEHLDQELARAVGDLRLAGERRIARDEAGDLDDPRDGVEAAGRRPAAAASPFSAQIRASAAASSTLTDAPTFPVACSLPSTSGS